MTNVIAIHSKVVEISLNKKYQPHGATSGNVRESVITIHPMGTVNLAIHSIVVEMLRYVSLN